MCPGIENSKIMSFNTILMTLKRPPLQFCVKMNNFPTIFGWFVPYLGLVDGVVYLW